MKIIIKLLFGKWISIQASQCEYISFFGLDIRSKSYGKAPVAMNWSFLNISGFLERGMKIIIELLFGRWISIQASQCESISFWTRHLVHRTDFHLNSYPPWQQSDWTGRYKSPEAAALMFNIFRVSYFLLSPNMQLLAAITTSLMLVSSTTAGI
jgi:hypothetical protein